MKSLGRMVVLVRDYDEAIDFYRDQLGFEVFVDIDAGPRRFVHLRLPAQPETGIWFVKAETEAPLARVGRQTEGQPCAVLYTDNLQEDYDRLTGKGVAFVGEPRGRRVPFSPICTICTGMNSCWSSSKTSDRKRLPLAERLALSAVEGSRSRLIRFAPPQTPCALNHSRSRRQPSSAASLR